MKPQYILSRLFQMALVLVGVSILVFVLTRVLPGDPVAAALHAREQDDGPAGAAFAHCHGHIAREEKRSHGVEVERVLERLGL